MKEKFSSSPRQTPGSRTSASVKNEKPAKIGKYKITETLARGGMGILYKGIHPTLKRPVVIKKLLYQKGKPELKERFKLEASVMMDLNHENIVRVFDHFTEGSNSYIVEEFIEGISLDRLLEERGPLSLEEFIPILTETARALEYIHSRGVVHRDIKPSNILIISHSDHSGTSRKIKITDFGIAANQNEKNVPFNTLTKPGIPVGSPLFMAPEQRGENPSSEIDARTDIYSLALLAYLSLFADLPPTSRRALKRNTASLPSFLRNLIYRGLAEKKKRRPKNLIRFISQAQRFSSQLFYNSWDSISTKTNSSNSKRNNSGVGETLLIRGAALITGGIILILFIIFGIKPLFFRVIAGDKWGGLDIIIPADKEYPLNSDTKPSVTVTRGSDLQTKELKLKMKQTDLGTDFTTKRTYFRNNESVIVHITTPSGVYTEYRTISSFRESPATVINAPKLSLEPTPIDIGFSIFDKESGEDITSRCDISLAEGEEWILLKDIPVSERKNIFVNGKSYLFLIECKGYKELRFPVTVPPGRKYMVNRIHLKQI